MRDLMMHGLIGAGSKAPSPFEAVKIPMSAPKKFRAGDIIGIQNDKNTLDLAIDKLQMITSQSNDGDNSYYHITSMGSNTNNEGFSVERIADNTIITMRYWNARTPAGNFAMMIDVKVFKEEYDRMVRLSEKLLTFDLGFNSGNPDYSGVMDSSSFSVRVKSSDNKARVLLRTWNYDSSAGKVKHGFIGISVDLLTYIISNTTLYTEVEDSNSMIVKHKHSVTERTVCLAGKRGYNMVAKVIVYNVDETLTIGATSTLDACQECGFDGEGQYLVAAFCGTSSAYGQGKLKLFKISGTTVSQATSNYYNHYGYTYARGFNVCIRGLSGCVSYEPYNGSNWLVTYKYQTFTFLDTGDITINNPGITPSDAVGINQQYSHEHNEDSIYGNILYDTSGYAGIMYPTSAPIKHAANSYFNVPAAGATLAPYFKVIKMSSFDSTTDSWMVFIWDDNAKHVRAHTFLSLKDNFQPQGVSSVAKTAVAEKIGVALSNITVNGDVTLEKDGVLKFSTNMLTPGVQYFVSQRGKLTTMDLGSTRRLGRAISKNELVVSADLRGVV